MIFVLNLFSLILFTCFHFFTYLYLLIIILISNPILLPSKQVFYTISDHQKRQGSSETLVIKLYSSLIHFFFL